jgi:Raf kinase inhibitor-like YbhB/YbcL family protein
MSLALKVRPSYSPEWQKKAEEESAMRMSTKRPARAILPALALAAGAMLQLGEAKAAEPFMLKSPALADNGELALKNAGNIKSNPNCVGENISPAFAWSNPPEGTKSYAMIIVDPEGLAGLGVVHWVGYGIPASTSQFAEGEISKPSDSFVGGKSTPNLATYMGPCTPPGDWHHYTFTLIATDLDPTALQPGLTRDELLAALKGHAKAASSVIGRFRHQ